MQKIPVKKGLLDESIKYPLIFFLILLLIFYVYTFFNPIPTPISAKTIGIGADYLAIGDRNFYFNENSLNYGYGDNGELKGSFLFPLILNTLAFITSQLGLGLIGWNTSVILLASCCSVASLFLINKSANIIFDKKTANIASWIFVLCPYTIFYSITGGITIYMTLGVSFFTYLISKSKFFNTSQYSLEVPITMILLLLNVLFLSSIRPTGSVFSIAVIIGLGINIYLKSLNRLINLSKTEKIFIYTTFSFCLAYALFQIKLNQNYLSFTYDNFISEGGNFFGLERELIRNKIRSIAEEDFEHLKSFIYLVTWKLTEFISGLSDIRDTHSSGNITAFFPFISRIFVGIFIIYPINLLAFLGIFIYWKKIYFFGLWITLSAAIICLVPNLIGVAFTRYLIMVYPPFIIISAKVFSLIINEFKIQIQKY